MSRWDRGLLLSFMVSLLLGGLSSCRTDSPQPEVTPLLRTPTTNRPVLTFTPVSSHTAAPTMETLATIPPQPKFTKTPKACTDSMEIVLNLNQDGNVLDGSLVLESGSPITAGWRVKNSGSCVWDTSYSLYFSKKDHPDWENHSSQLHLEKSIHPGETLDIWVEAILPLSSGMQSASWELRNGRGARVGPLLPLAFETARIPVDATDVGRWFEAYPTSVQPGDRVALSWSVSDAKEVYLYGPEVADGRYPVEPIASRYITPKRTSQYQLHVVNGDGSIEKLFVTVEVEPLLAPRIRLFNTYEPTGDNECYQIEWLTENRVNRVLIYRNGELIWDGLLDDGRIQDCPPGGRAVYIIEVYGPGGMVSKTRVVEVH